MNRQNFIKKIFHYSKRIQTLGIKKSSIVALQKIQKKLSNYSLRKRAVQGNFNWKEIADWQKINLSFEQFLNYNRNNDFLKNFEQEELFQTYIPASFKNKEYTIQQADLILQNRFTILGCTKTFGKKIPWHDDIKNNYTFNANSFYQDIQPNAQEATSFDDYFSDIKVPWELSRMNHLYILGKAYETTSDEKYAHYFQDHIVDWITHNKFLLGVNWVCPMDVALRALNILWGWHFFKNSPSISASFWKQLTCSLYGHAYYLEHNWENFPPTSNHYLSDLIGYFYLCFFFEQFPYFQKQKLWCYEELLKEFDVQIQEDGTSYEGSTHYHILITELYLHFVVLGTIHSLKFSNLFMLKLKKMLQFIEDITDEAGNIVYIGDMDGGKIMTGLENTNKARCVNYIQHYKNFGLTIIKDKGWHITFRNQIYSTHQPSGHFHEDDLSITVSLNRIPIFIDPGSYLYTANSLVRNYMRNKQCHNLYSMQNNNCISKKNYSQLFQLSLSPQNYQTEVFSLPPKIIINNQSDENQEEFGIKKFRSLYYSFEEKLLIITDWLEGDETHLANSTINWSFILHPSITLEKKNSFEILIKNKNNLSMTFNSPLPLRITPTFFSKHYGKVEKCLKIECSTSSKTLQNICFNLTI